MADVMARSWPEAFATRASCTAEAVAAEAVVSADVVATEAVVSDVVEIEAVISVVTEAVDAAEAVTAMAMPEAIVTEVVCSASVLTAEAAELVAEAALATAAEANLCLAITAARSASMMPDHGVRDPDKRLRLEMLWITGKGVNGTDTAAGTDVCGTGTCRIVGLRGVRGPRVCRRVVVCTTCRVVVSAWGWRGVVRGLSRGCCRRSSRVHNALLAATRASDLE